MILETHDVQSRILRERGDTNPWTHLPDSWERLLRAEKALLEQADVLVHCSVDDMHLFQAELPHKPHVLALPVVDESFMTSVKDTAPGPKTIDLLFVGAGNIPNLAALEWFFEQVWPRINDREYNLKIVGAVDELVMRYLPQIYQAFRDCFVGTVEDLSSHYRLARCVIAPMVSGGGI